MDFNIVVLSGKLATAPEVRAFESGSRLIRYLVTTRSETPLRRVDVVPVILWDPDESHLAEDAAAGRSVWVAGSVQRRFWTAEDGRRSRLEVIAHHVEVKEPDSPAEPA